MTKTGTDLALNLDWFENPVTYIEGIPQNRDAILDLLRDVLGDKSGISPDGNDWYQIKYEDEETPVYVVLPSDTTSPSSVIALGLFHELAGGTPSTANLWATVPLFELPLTSAIVVTGSAQDPITLAIDLSSTNHFSTGTATFDGLEFRGHVTFSSDPSFELDFLTLTPASQQSTY